MTKIFLGVLFAPIVTVIAVVYVITHPKWTLKAYRGYQEIVREGGAFFNTDFYKITMGAFIWKFFRFIGVTFKLVIRKTIVFPDGFGDELQKRVEKFAAHHHSIKPAQAAWLKLLPFMDDDFIDYLADISQPKLFAKHVNIVQEGSNLSVTISGPWLNTSWLETILMPMITELLNEMTGRQLKKGWLFRSIRKGWLLKLAGIIFSEFGTRRRDSFKYQYISDCAFVATGVTKTAKSKGGMIGTSNVFIAYTLGLKAIGTMAHELFLVLGAVYGYDKANLIVFYFWKLLYGNDLGYFLPDTYSSKKCYEQMTEEDAHFFTGPRQDSGDPEKFVDETVAFYQRVGLTAKQIRRKVVIFSDSLNVEKASRYVNYAFSKGISAACGIGSFLTTDEGNQEIVIKPFEAWVIGPDGQESRHVECFKASDDPKKHTGGDEAGKHIIHWLNTGEITWSQPLLTCPQAVIEAYHLHEVTTKGEYDSWFCN